MVSFIRDFRLSILTRNHVNPKLPVFITTCVNMKAQSLGSLSVAHDSCAEKAGSDVRGALLAKRASRNSCSLGVSHFAVRGDLG